MTLTIKLDGNWSSFQLANNTPPLSVTGSVIAPSARMPSSGRLHVVSFHECMFASFFNFESNHKVNSRTRKHSFLQTLPTFYQTLLAAARRLATSREILLWMTPSEAPKALQASECSELLDPMRASCWISAQH